VELDTEIFITDTTTAPLLCMFAEFHNYYALRTRFVIFVLLFSIFLSMFVCNYFNINRFHKVTAKSGIKFLLLCMECRHGLAMGILSVCLSIGPSVRL